MAGPNQCDSEEVAAGSAFIEPAGAVHTVTNTGRGSALIWWATVFPVSDGVAPFTPSFKSGGVYPADVTSCH